MIQPERGAFQSRGRRSGAVAAGFVTEPWEARKWLEGVSPETRPTRRSDPKDEPTGADLERIDRSRIRSGRGEDEASWTRASFSGGAGERPRGRTMGQCGKRRGFSRRAGLEFSGTTATARVFGTEAAAPRRGLCPSGPRLSVPHRTNRAAPCGAAIAVDGQKTPPHPGFDGASQECRGGAASHPRFSGSAAPSAGSPATGLPRGARELETRPFSRGKVKVPGHSKVFPIGMCYIWEVEGDDNFEVFKEVPIYKTNDRHKRVQPILSVGPFFSNPGLWNGAHLFINLEM